MGQSGLFGALTMALMVASLAAACTASIMPLETGSQAKAEAAHGGHVALHFTMAEAWASLGGKRRLAQVGAKDRATITVDGLGLPSPMLWQGEADEQGVIAVPGVPTGGVRVVKLALQSASEPGASPAELATLVRLDAQASRPQLAPLGPAWSVVGRIAEQILAYDRAERSKVLDKVKPEELASAVVAIAQTGALASPSELNSRSLALKVRARGGQAPNPRFEAGDALDKGSLVLHPQGWPPGLWAMVRLSDPISRPTFWNGEGPLLMEGVAAGNWQLDVLPERPGLPQLHLQVGVPANASGRVGVGFAQAEAAVGLPYPLSPGFGGVLGLGDRQHLLLGGGLTTNQGQGLGSLQSLLRRERDGTWHDLGNWPVPLRASPSATGPNGELVSFGGTLVDGSLSSAAYLQEAVASSVPRSMATIPSNLRRQDGVAIHMGDRYWVVGGTNADGTAMPPMAMLEAGAAALVRAPVELPTGRSLVAGALVGKRWLVVGGVRLPSPSEADAGAEFSPDVLGVTEAFEVGSPLRWTQLAPMPTPRAGAGAVAVNDELWVLGGADRLGRPLTTVEVLKVSLGTWVTKPPLLEGRVRPVVAYLNGRIVVAGGAKGLGPNASPLASVELVKP